MPNGGHSMGEKVAQNAEKSLVYLPTTGLYTQQAEYTSESGG